MGNLAVGVQGSSYYDWAKKGAIYIATAKITTPVIYTTAAGTGGPLLWNNSGSGAGGTNEVLAVILAISAVLVTATSVASTLGLTGNSGQSSAPSSTTAINAVACTYIGANSNTPICNTYRIGTVTNAGNFFMPTHTLDTGAITTVNTLPCWVDIGGAIVVPPGSWCSMSAAATATSAVINVGMMWCEVPVL